MNEIKCDICERNRPAHVCLSDGQGSKYRVCADCYTGNPRVTVAKIMYQLQHKYTKADIKLKEK